MSRAWWSFYTQQRINEAFDMGQRIVFFREARVETPTLRFNGHELEPYDMQATEHGWHLYYLPGTEIPASPNTWPD